MTRLTIERMVSVFTGFNPRNKTTALKAVVVYICPKPQTSIVLLAILNMTDYIRNKKVTFDFELLETFEAGVALLGTEVKALRTGKASLNGAYVVIRGDEAWLLGASISPYQVANAPKKYDPERTRKLLLTKKQLDELKRYGEQPGLTIVAVKWYNEKRHIKLQIALARGKKKADKREKLKERDTKRDILRILKNQ
jgi:SsrA-binding protein